MYWNSSGKFQKEVDSWIKDPTYKANLQTSLLLIRLEWFQNIVQQARKDCKIPKKGFMSKLYNPKEIGAYLLIENSGEWQPQNKINEPIDFYLNEIFEKANLPGHFKRFIEKYIY